jgi:hypothetical protein
LVYTDSAVGILKAAVLATGAALLTLMGSLLDGELNPIELRAAKTVFEAVYYLFL